MDPKISPGPATAPEVGARRKRFGKRFLLLGIPLLLVLATIRPVFHLAKTAWNDADELASIPGGTVDDASRLDQTPVAEIWEIPRDPDIAEKQLAQLLQRARAAHLKMSVAGARHSMGGHAIMSNGISINMLPFNRMELNATQDTLHVQAGARWSEVIRYLNERGRSVEVMQSNDDFSVGGSLSVNCHGWQFNRPPIASTVESFRLVRADGHIVTCSRTENRELFSLTLGGYGLFGIILDADLRVTRNERYRIERATFPAKDYATVLEQRTAKATNAAMVYGRLSVSEGKFLDEGILNIFHRLDVSNSLVSGLGEPKHAGLKRLIFRGSAGSDYGKRLRWTAETDLDPYLSGQDFERNQILYEPAGWFQNRARATTDVLMECFVPPAQFASFVVELRRILPEEHADLLNVTVRHVKQDDDTFLRYADKDMLSLVMLFVQTRDADGEEKMSKLARDVITAALRHNGRYYLPYRLHAAPDQFAAAYPQAREFFDLKRKYDPEELFQNQFYLKYGHPVPVHER
jgi:FAD/FMN-containing dehydrogenase